MPKLPIKISNIPRPPIPAWLTNHENKAKGYSYVNIVVHVYQMYSFWFDIHPFGMYFQYGLIYCAFVIGPVGLGFFLLIAIHKRELRKVGIWWAIEIGLFLLNINLFIVGVYGISWKTMINLFLHGALRIFGLKIIYDYMVSLSSEIFLSINKVNVTNGSGGSTHSSPHLEDVPLDDPWTGEEKL